MSEAGLKVGSINMPMTFPPVPVNGFLISGFETPGPESDFVYPPTLRSEVLARWPDPTLASKWKRKFLGGNALFQQNVDYMSRSFHQGAEMTMHLGDRFGWDALMVVLKLVDNLQHKTWKYIDPRWSSRNRSRCRMVKGAFDEMDQALGVLLDYATEQRAAVLIVSDHGHGSLEGKCQPNLLLQCWGYLTLLRGAARRAWAKALQRQRTTRSRHIGDVEREIPIDYARTAACVMHAGNAGFLYVNLRGRQPTGIVDPADYESLRDELIRRLTAPEARVRYRHSTIPLFQAVHKPEALYGCERAEQPWLPDLLLIPHDILSVTRQVRGGRVVRWLPYRRLEGTHRADGILVATGPGVAHSSIASARIIDCAPTLLAMMGLRVPEEMTGRVLLEMFSTTPVVEREATTVTTRERAVQQVYSEEELRLVTERLSDLGYLQ
jgi:predicted AlkP superfamily phosphohydrolase/phosphomutase